MKFTGAWERLLARPTTFPIKAYYVSDKYLDLGKTTDAFNNVVLPVYDRERTVCDCFKYRNKLDSELFTKALAAYAEDKNKNLSRLSDYAKTMRQYDKIMSLMEVVLND